MRAAILSIIVAAFLVCAVVESRRAYLGNRKILLDQGDNDDEESDSEFLGKALKKIGKVAIDAGKVYVGSKYGIQLDDEEDEEEADAEFLKNVLKKVGKVALQAGKAYVGSKYGIQLDEEEDEIESDSGIANGATLQATTSVNIRNGPCTSNGLVGSVAPGQRVTYRGETKSGCGYTWYRIDKGWVASNYFTVVSGGGGSSGGSDCGESYTQGKATGRKQCVKIDGQNVVTSTAEVFNRMKAAAAANGVNLKINSGFRTMAEQQYFYNCYVSKKCNNGNLAAKPGYSNHQNGIALDISTAGNAYNWLVNNASKFGFVRTVPSENWHWELRNSKCNAFVSYSCK